MDMAPVSAYALTTPYLAHQLQYQENTVALQPVDFPSELGNKVA
jgi:hypothetical protein